MPLNPRKYDLEDRLIAFSHLVCELASRLKKTRESTNLSGQLIRSSTSAALNYGEAQVAESKADFIHKTGICLKELKETSIAIKLISDRTITGEHNGLIEKCKQECSELTAIFVKSIQTARANSKRN